MRFIRQLFAALLIFATVASAEAAFRCEKDETDAQCVARYGQTNISLVYTKDADGGFEGTGTAVRIAPNTELTAWHVVEGSDYLRFGGHDHTLLADNEHTDLSLHYVECIYDTEYAEILKIAPKMGTMVYTIGYPGGKHLALESGYWMGQPEPGMPHVAFHTASTLPGNSGGALVIVEDGEVKLAGLTNWGKEVNGSIVGQGWVTHSRAILEFLTEAAEVE